MDHIRDYINPIIEEALRNREVDEKSNRSVLNGAGVGGENEMEKEEESATGTVSEGETLLSHLVKETDDKTIITDETFNILIAGRDTTAALLTFTVYMLAMHPKVMKRLREEVFEHVGTTRLPTYDDVRSMKYLRAVLNETLRLFPPV